MKAAILKGTVDFTRSDIKGLCLTIWQCPEDDA